MRITLANLSGCVIYQAACMGELERPTEFQGQHDPAQMNAGGAPQAQCARSAARSARALQLFGRLAVLETHTLRY